MSIRKLALDSEHDGYESGKIFNLNLTGAELQIHQVTYVDLNLIMLLPGLIQLMLREVSGVMLSKGQPTNGIAPVFLAAVIDASSRSKSSYELRSVDIAVSTRTLATRTLAANVPSMPRFVSTMDCVY
jgi:hypothetical protein